MKIINKIYLFFFSLLVSLRLKEDPFYRFLTEDEMIEKYGYKWPMMVSASWGIDMLYLLGKRLPTKIAKNVLKAYEDESIPKKNRIYRAALNIKGCPVGVTPSFALHADMIKLDPKRIEYDVPHAGFATLPGNGEAGRSFEKICEKYAEWKEEKRQYRFKTKQELIDEVGENLNKGVEFGWNDEMTDLCGLPVHTFEAAHLYYCRASNPRSRLISFPYPNVLINARLRERGIECDIKGHVKSLNDMTKTLAKHYETIINPMEAKTKRQRKKRELALEIRSIYSEFVDSMFFSFSGSMIISTEREKNPIEVHVSSLKK